jgi:hypothetical protein
MKLAKFDWDKGEDVPFRANDKVVAEFVQFFLSSKAWHDDIELIHKRVRRLRRDVEYVKPEETRQGAQVRA